MGFSSSCSDNLINFQDISSPSEIEVARELEKRFWEGKFYTWVGLSLLAVNPGKHISDLYTPQLKSYYEEIWKKNKLKNIPPHIYAVSSRAKYLMLQEIGKVSQTIVLTGESGSGKTHSTNHLLEFLVGFEGEHFSRSNSSLCQWANVLLKAFGNAETVCNSDSSRFGKFIQLHWNNEAYWAPHFLGAQLDAYLLEKTRVTDFPDGWNFHIFHQITSGLREDDAVALYFPPSRKFRIAPRAHSDLHCKSYKETVEAAEKIGISKNDWWCALEILAAILHLGNVDFQDEDEDTCTIKSNQESKEGMRRGCHLLGMEESLLIQLFTTKLIVANGHWNSRLREQGEDRGGRGDTRGTQVEEGHSLRRRLNCIPPTRRPSIFRKQCSMPSECCARRDGILRHLYQSLFHWLLKCINSRLSLEHGTDLCKHKIGLLDVFGFEIFEKNGLEQLCINYTNERLQRFYVQNDLMKTQKLMEEEGFIPLGTEYNFDRITRESLFDTPPSIFSILNDIPFENIQSNERSSQVTLEIAGMCAWEKYMKECRITWRSTNKTVLDKLAGLHSPYIVISPIEKSDFMVRHYAGNVIYSTTGMVAKNSDKVPDELLEFLALSNNDFLKDLLHQGEQRKHVGKATHLIKFVESLNELMKRLNDTDVHYVHCLKPHPIIKTGIIDSTYFVQQLKYAGVIESIDLHKKAFPIRMTFDEFLERYHMLTVVNNNYHLNPLLAPTAVSQNSGSEDDQGSHESEWTEEKKLKFKCEEIIGSIFKNVEPDVKWGRSSLFLSESNLVLLDLKKEGIHNEAASIIQRHWRKFKSRSAPDENASMSASPISIRGDCSVPISKTNSGVTFNFETGNLMQRRWAGYNGQYLRNLWKNLEQTSYSIQGKCGEGLVHELYGPENEKALNISVESWMKTYSPTGLNQSCAVMKDLPAEWSSWRGKHYASSVNSKSSSSHKSILRSIHCGSGIISRQKIPEVPVRFHTKHTCLPFSHCLPVTLLPQGIPDAFSYF